MKVTSKNPSFWTKHFEAQAKSGLTVGEYCKRHGVTGSCWYYWRRKRSMLQLKAKQNFKEPQFVPVVIKSEPVIQPAHMALRIPGGIELVFDVRTDPQQLATIVRHLKKEAS